MSPLDDETRRAMSAEALRERREVANRRRQAVRRRRLAALGVVGVVLAAVAVLAFRGRDGSGQGTASAQTNPPGSPPPPGSTPTRPRTPPTGNVRITAMGDIVMGSPPYGLPPDGGASFFDPVDDLIAGDVVLGNLEGTLATGGSSKCGSGSTNCYAFRTPPSYSRWLREAGFTIMNLANNHAYDFGPQGQRETIQALNRVRVLHTGKPGQVTVQTVRGIRVAVIGFASYPWANLLTDIPNARRQVARARQQADIVVVTMHAGAEGSDRTHVSPGTETFLGENRGDSMAFSRAVIDAGADIVIGHGPHVMRGMEFYKGRLIAYSLGNFAGYEVFSLGGTLSTSGILQVTLRADGTYVNGRLRATQIVGAGTPAPGGSGVSLVSELSREDFGSRAARISSDGTIRRP